MGQDSKIQWTAHTFNPWRGCTKVSDGCKNCYAEKMSGRNPKVLGVWGPNGARVVAAESYWKQPLKWNAEAKDAGERRRVFCASLADVFEGPATMPETAFITVRRARVRLMETIIMTPHLDWLLLTKRPELVDQALQDVIRDSVGDSCASLMAQGWLRGDAPRSVWLGTSVEDQQRADERIPHLLRCPAAVRFLSCEPLLAEIDLLQVASGPLCPQNPVHRIDVLRGGTWNLGGGFTSHSDIPGMIDWVIAGGESGPGARPCTIGHIRSLVHQCQAAGVACFVKQLGAKPVNREGVPHPLKDAKGGDPAEWPEDLRVREMPTTEGCLT